MYTNKEVKDLIQEIREFAGGMDSQLDEYLIELKKSI